MAKNTQAIILETFNQMLERMPFEKITVSALIKECNIGRNTFYYHYEDIYALLDDAILKSLGEYENTVLEGNWKDAVKDIMSAAASREAETICTSTPTAMRNPVHLSTMRIPISGKKVCWISCAPPCLWRIAADSRSMKTCCVPAPCWKTRKSSARSWKPPAPGPPT